MINKSCNSDISWINNSPINNKDETMIREFGFAVLPRTYLITRKSGLFTKLSAFWGGIHELCQRAWIVKNKNIKQIGFSGAFAKAAIGHTFLYSQAKTSNQQLIEQLATGFAPDGFLAKMCLVLKIIEQPLLIASATSFIGIALLKAKLTNKWCFSSIVCTFISCYCFKYLCTKSIPGKFHIETGNEQDQESIGIMFQFGPGIYSQFITKQNDLVISQSTPYEFYPDLYRTNNCVSAAILQMRQFINYIKQKQSLIGELQSVIQRLKNEITPNKFLQAIKKNQKNRIYTINQYQEHLSLTALDKLISKMEHTIKRQQQQNKTRNCQHGNQGYLTTFMKHRGASHAVFNNNQPKSYQLNQLVKPTVIEAKSHEEFNKNGWESWDCLAKQEQMQKQKNLNLNYHLKENDFSIKHEIGF